MTSEDLREFTEKLGAAISGRLSKANRARLKTTKQVGGDNTLSSRCLYPEPLLAVLPATVLTLVETGEGVSIVPACVRNMSSNGVRFYRLQADDANISLVAAGKRCQIRAYSESLCDTDCHVHSRVHLRDVRIRPSA